MERNIVIDFKVAGARIRNARQRLGLTQEKAAERTTLTGQYWSLLETGRSKDTLATFPLPDFTVFSHKKQSRLQGCQGILTSPGFAPKLTEVPAWFH